ncbi:hypothetical protein PLESTM_000891500 [Pleodorina starrii]|nr:hypothetical protein PLESTM_000891500 [Pleodorina starrii]
MEPLALKQRCSRDETPHRPATAVLPASIPASIPAAVPAAVEPAAPDPSRIWIPQLVERFASLLPPNDVACSLRLVDKATAALFRHHHHHPQSPPPHFVTVRLSRSVPHHAFARRWGHARALAPLTWRQRRQLLRLTVRSGSLPNLEILLDELDEHCPLGPDVLEAAAGAGALAMCQALRRRGCPWSDGALRAAAAGGHQATCEWLLATGGCPLPWSSEAALLAAARGGHSATCEWMLASGCRPWSSRAPGEAAAGGHVGLMDRLLAAAEAAAAAAPPPPGGVDVDVGALLRGAAQGCSLATLQRLYDRYGRRVAGQHAAAAAACSWGEFLIPAAVLSPTPDWQAKAEWLAGRVPPAYDEQEVVTRVGRSVHLYGRSDWRARLDWLRRRLTRAVGHERTDEFVWAAVLAGNTAAADDLLPPPPPGDGRVPPWVPAVAVGEGHLPMLHMLEARGHLPDPGMLRAALRSGRLAVVRWVSERLERLDAGLGQHQQHQQQRPQQRQRQPLGLGLSPELFSAGASSGSVEVLEWLRGRGCPWDARTFAAAAGAGSEEALEWLAERGCPMGDDGAPYIQPAARGDLSVLRCLRRLGCPWSDSSRGDTFNRCAAAVGDDPVGRLCDRPVGLQWLLEQGCPVDWSRLSNSLRQQVVQWLREIQS